MSPRWHVTNGRFWALGVWEGRRLLGATSREAEDGPGWDWWTADFKRRGHEPTRELAIAAIERAVA